MELYKLDKKDRHLLSLLYLNSRASFTELGKRLKLSSSTVERRMQQLKDAGIISLLFADVDMAKLGLRNYRIYLRFDVFDSKTENGVIEMFESYPKTTWATICEGTYDVLWRIVAKDEFEVEKALGIAMEKFGNNIVEKRVITTIYQTYLSWNRIMGGERHKELPIEAISATEKLDQIDMKILASLYGNARETTVEIAKLIGLTPDAVAYRIKQLIEKKLILGYTAWYNTKNLGFEYYKIFINFRSMTKENEKSFLAFCLQHNNVVFINKCMGTWDIEVDITVENTLELHGFISEIKTKYGKIIGDHSYVSVIEERMLNPLRENIVKAEDKGGKL